MANELEGKLLKILAEQTGISKNGTAWFKRDFVIETQEQYSKTVCFSAWGDKRYTIANMSVGQTVKISFNLESNEGKDDRWFTNAIAWKIEQIGAIIPPTQQTSQTVPTEQPINNNEVPPPSEDETDLPF